jgi:hypothetical protein
MEVQMKNQPNTKKQAPLDIQQVRSFLQDFRTDLTDVMMMAVDEWSDALQDDIQAWQENDGPEPGWQSYRNWMNEICREDVMPILFPELPVDEFQEEQTESPAEDSLQPDDPSGFVPSTGSHRPGALPGGRRPGKGDAVSHRHARGTNGAHDYIPDWICLPGLYGNEGQPNPMAIIKLFTPWSNWTWFLLEHDGEDLCFGLVVGLETELGYISLKELEEIRGPAGLRIERDVWFRPTPVRDLPEYKACWGNGGPYSGRAPIGDQPPDAPAPPEPTSAAVLPNSESNTAPPRALSDGWTGEDIRFLLEKLAESPILVAQSRLGIPTIHDNFGAETRHMGFGLMQVEGSGYTLRFDAGGAMKRTPSGQGWTKLIIEGWYDGYDRDAVHQALSDWLVTKPRPGAAEPWQLTRLAYQTHKAERVVGGVPILNGADGEEHERLVCAAAARGEAVPARVLADYPDLFPEESGVPTNNPQATDGESSRWAVLPSAYPLTFSRQVTGGTAGDLLVDVASIVPDMSGVGGENQLISPEKRSEFERWELALLTGLLSKPDSAFYQALRAIAHLETLQLALEHIPAADPRRRELVEKRMAAISAEEAPSAD